MKNILITGAGGMLGATIANKFKDKYNVFTTSRSKNINISILNHLIFDLEIDEPQLLIDWSKPDIIIHCGAITSIDYCESNKSHSRKVNLIFIQKLFKVTKKVKFIFISSDAVFSDSFSKDYFNNEQSLKNPLNYYGKLKLLGEEEIKKNSDYLIIRCTPVGLNMNSNKESFSEWIINSSIKKTKINLYNNVFFTPISIWKLTSEIMWMIDNELDGIYHLSSSTSISKFDFAIKLCHSLNISDEYIVSFVKKNIKNKTKRLYNQNLSNVHYVETFHRDLDNISNLFKDFKKNYKKKIYK